VNSCRLIHSFGGKPMLKLIKDFTIPVRWYQYISHTCDVRLSFCVVDILWPTVARVFQAYTKTTLRSWMAYWKGIRIDQFSSLMLFLRTRFVKFDNATDLTTEVLRFDSRTRKIFLSSPLSPNRSWSYTASYHGRTGIFCPTVKAVGSWEWALTCV